MGSVKNQQTKNIYYWPSERDEILNFINGDQLNDLLNILTEVNNNTTCKEESSYLDLAAGTKSILKKQKQGESKPLRGIPSKRVSFKLPENDIVIRTQKPSKIPIFNHSKFANKVHKATTIEDFNSTYTPVVKSAHSKAHQIASSSRPCCFKVNDTTYKEVEQRTYLNTTAEKRSILKKQVAEEFIPKPSAKRVSFKLPENEIPSRTQKPSRIPILIRSKLGRGYIREPIYTKIPIAKAPTSSCSTQSPATNGFIKAIPADNIRNTKSMNSTPNLSTTSTASSVKCAVESHQNNSSSKIEIQIYRGVFSSSGFYLEQIF